MTMATHLPTEILQSILLSLDLESFYSARFTCSSWHHAASNAFILRSALAEAPVSLPETLDTLPTPQDWNTYFTQFAQRTLLDRRFGIEKQASKRILPGESTSPTTPVALSPDGTKIAALKGARIVLHDFHRDTDTSTFARSRSLYPVWACVCRALVYGGGGGGTGTLPLSQRYAKSRIALSTHGDLVAVALGRTIQIYDLAEQALAEPPAEFVLGDKTTEFVSSAPLPQTYHETDGVVESIAFAGDEDLLLRVVIGRESGSGASSHTRVRYLGDPARACSSFADTGSNTQSNRLAYWRANLHRIYLDSTALAASFSQSQSQPQPANTEPISLTGLFVLPNSVASNLSLPLSPSPSLSLSPSAPSSHTYTHTHTHTYTYFLCALHQSPKNTYCLARIPTPSPSQPPQPQPHPTILSTFPTRPSNPSPPYSHSHSHSHSPNSDPNPKHPPITPESAFTHHILTLAQQRWDPANLPSATTPATGAATATPILAVADDGAVFVVYEPGAGHSYRGGSGGAVYVYSLVGVGGRLELGEGVGEGNGIGSEIPAWSFLLDIVDVDVEGVWVVREAEREKESGGWGVGRRGVYRITAVAGGKMLEWRLK